MLSTATATRGNNKDTLTRLLDSRRNEAHSNLISLLPEEIMPRRSKTGQAISPARNTPEELSLLRSHLLESDARSDLDTWRRCSAVLSSLEGVAVIILAEQLSVGKSSINQLLHCLETLGTAELWPRKAPGAVPRLSPEQRQHLVELV